MTDVASRVMMLLRKSGGMSAMEVAEALGVSRPTAYKHLKVLRKALGAALAVRRERVSARGPKSKVYTITGGRK